MKKYILVLLICVFWGCKSNEKKSIKNNILNNSSTVNNTNKTTIELNDNVFVDALTGLNYRKTPKGKLLGKLKHNTKIKVLKKTGIIEEIIDDGNTIKGEWIGTLVNNDTVYVFDGFLSHKKVNYETFQFEQYFCVYKGKFNTNKFTKKQLKTTLNRIKQGVHIAYIATPFKLDDIKNLSTDDLHRDYKNTLKQIEDEEFVNTPYWHNLKQKYIDYINQVYELKKHTILSFENPIILNDYTLVNNDCIFYKNALINGGDALIKAWQKLNEVQKSNNSDPDNLQKEFDIKFNSDQKLAYARLDVTTFGWYNAANSLLQHNISSSENADMAFRRLFVELEDLGCDEP